MSGGTGANRTVGGLSPLARRGLIALACGLLVLAGLAVLPYVLKAQIADEVAAQKAELALVSARAARAEARRQSLTEADQPERMFIAGGTEGAALAAFQTLVNEAAARTGLSILRTQPLPADAEEGLRPYRLAVDAAGNLEQLRAFLVDIESSLPIVIVTGFEIVPRTSGSAEANPYPSEALLASLRLEAYGKETTP